MALSPCEHARIFVVLWGLCPHFHRCGTERVRMKARRACIAAEFFSVACNATPMLFCRFRSCSPTNALVRCASTLVKKENRPLYITSVVLATVYMSHIYQTSPTFGVLLSLHRRAHCCDERIIFTSPSIIFCFAACPPPLLQTAVASRLTRCPLPQVLTWLVWICV